MTKIAVILLTMGGPDTRDSIKPFLFNLFNDRAILRIPQPFRFLISKFISSRRAQKAQETHSRLGGKSPILENTRIQARALEKSLNEASSDPQFKTFIAMRYWHPFALEAAQEVKAFAPDEIILLPLYPQYSTTTTQSSLQDWQDKALEAGLDIPARAITCYPQEHGFIRALAASTRLSYDAAKEFGVPRVLFSAQGLPEEIAKAGDPYPDQCTLTAQALRRELGIENLDSVLCFQSRVGPMKWIGPSTEDEVRRAGHDKVPLVVVPIAFVSDHSETLVEIDIKYRALALRSGAPFFSRVPAVGAAPDFIDSLVQIVRDVRTQKNDCLCLQGG